MWRQGMYVLPSWIGWLANSGAVGASRVKPVTNPIWSFEVVAAAHYPVRSFIPGCCPGFIGICTPENARTSPSTCPESLASIYFGRSSAWIRCLSPDRRYFGPGMGFDPHVNRSRPTRCTSMGTRGFNFLQSWWRHHIACRNQALSAGFSIWLFDPQVL